MAQESTSRLSIFEIGDEQRRELSAALAEIVAAQQKEVLSKFMLEENVLHFKHGAQWNYPANSFSEDGKMESIQAEFLLPFDRIIDGDMTLISESIGSITKQLTEAIVSKLYETMSGACDRSGNVIKGGDFPSSVLAALEKMEFSVGADGNVELPQLHIHPDQAKKLQEQPAEFLEKVREVRERKSEDAVRRERERIAKFKSASV